MTDIAFPYRPKPLTMFLASAFFAICTPVMAHIANANDRGVIIEGLIRLDVEQAKIFYWVLFVCGLILTIGGIYAGIRGLTSRHQLVLGAQALRVPKSGLSNQIVAVSYADITALNRFAIKNQQFLTIRFGKRKVDITAGMLPNTAAFEDVCQTVARRVEETRGAAKR